MGERIYLCCSLVQFPSLPSSIQNKSHCSTANGLFKCDAYHSRTNRPACSYFTPSIFSFLYFTDVLLVTYPTMASTRGQGFVDVFYLACEMLQTPRRHPASDNIFVVLPSTHTHLQTTAYAIITHTMQCPYHRLVTSQLHQVHFKLLIRILRC
jgi:hypothetical protein